MSNDLAAADAAAMASAASDAAAAANDLVAHHGHHIDHGQNDDAVMHPHENNRWSKNGYGQAAPAQASGKFSKEESEQVKRAIEEYCTAKSITPARLCSECDHKTELKGAWMEISRALPHRTVQSVYRHGLRQLHPFRRGAWTDDEVQKLIQHVERYGKKWAAIQAKLNRSADSCRDKHREISSEFIKGRWKDEETETLKAIIREELSVSPDTGMIELAKVVERDGITIPWSAISKKMGNRSRLSCFKKWQKMTGLGEKVTKSAGAISDAKKKAAVAAAAAAVPTSLGGGDDDLTPNSIGGEAGEDSEAAAAQIAAETVEAVDLPVLDEAGGGGRQTRSRGRSAHVSVSV
mmetsp:Transcript_27252/g.60534  ORF Transcript_27252/g.60534 Transcript_27252/m.60534 type:complete len:350 (-) Transcript_27252:210-1259(-)